jgi:outer membrane protein assembly factor BamA
VNHLDVFSLIDNETDDVIIIEDSPMFDVKATAGIEVRFHTPVLQQPLRLIYGCKVLGDFNDDENTCSFSFSIGRTFQ